MHLLRELGTVRNVPTLARVPRGLERRYAAVRVRALEWCLDSCAAGSSPESQELWTRLAIVLPWLLLRDERKETSQQEAVTNQPFNVRRVVADRLKLAESAEWFALAQ